MLRLNLFSKALFSFPLFALFLAACSPQEAGESETALQDSGNESARLNEWLDAQYAAELDFSPLAKTRLGDKSAHGELDDVSEQAMQARLDWRRDSVARLQQEFDYEQLNAEAKRSLGLPADSSRGGSTL